MTARREWELVERPLLEHLGLLGWETLIWSDRRPFDDVDRSSDRDALLERRLRSALLKINPGRDGAPWLDAARLDSAVAELRSVPAGMRLLEANRRSTELLLNGTTVAGPDGSTVVGLIGSVVPDLGTTVSGESSTAEFSGTAIPGPGGTAASDAGDGRDRHIRYIDWDDPSANDYLAVSQFTVATPGRAPNIRPDVTLFVNGTPLVVIEAKPPGADGGIVDAIEQLRRYANQRGGESPEGAEQLFRTNQFTVATTGERAEAAAFSALPEHYLAWKDPYPATRDEVAARLGKPADALTQQEVLTAGMLAPERLLDIVRHFTLFKEAGPGRTEKLVGRYQQYRGVRRAVRRLATGATRAADGHVDRRGGVIWHTQGSGKSLTMVFLIRAMRSHPELRRFKIVLVTDRIDLQTQLGATAGLTGETVKVARTSAEVRELLGADGPGVVMAMIQKWRDTGDGGDGLSADEDFGAFGGFGGLGTLNRSEAILVLVDEAHRSQASTLHAGLMAALPNAARIGFTGTPIIMGERKKTLEIFGDYLDRYTLTESEADRSTVPVLYEGRTTDAAVSGASQLDDASYRWFAGLGDAQRQALARRYATASDVLEAPELIAAKARDMLRHYIATVMPDGFKGMIVATSRKACVRYHAALRQARDELVAEIERRRDELLGPPAEPTGAEEAFLRAAARQVDLIRALEFAPVISGDHNDPADYARWTDKASQQRCIDRFRLPLGAADDKRSPLALLIVKSMLLTGFDVPQAQVLYLDRLIQQAELLQAVARVNRTAPKKSHGLVVDYHGVSSQLGEALAVYAGADGGLDSDAGGALRPLSEEIGRLEPQRRRVRQVFVQRGVEPAATPDALEACVQLLADERLRAAFDVALRGFLTTLDTVLPRPEALAFTADAALFGEIDVQTRRRYRDTPDGDFDPHKYAEKVRRLIDEHVVALDLSQAIPPVRITDPAFGDHIAGTASQRARASEMEHALRHHIRERVAEDPVHYARLSERIDEILHRLEERWEQIALEFDGLIAEVNAGRRDEQGTGLDPTTELPFYDLMIEAATGADCEAVVSDSEAVERVVELTRELVADVRRISGAVGFWDNATRQDELRKAVKRTLDDSDLFAYDRLDALAVEAVAIAKANQHRLR